MATSPIMASTALTARTKHGVIMPRQPEHAIKLDNFAQLRSADIRFGDLTVLVGPQATGKSLMLQFWKLIQDRGEVYTSLKNAGFDWSTDGEYLERCLGEGWRDAWHDDTVLATPDREWSLRDLRIWKGGKRTEGSVFYVPAHRTLVLENGWPKLFQQYTPDTPVVVRLYSQTLHGIMGRTTSTKGDPTLFPHKKRLKAAFKKAIDDAAFHGGALKLSQKGIRRRLFIEYGRDGAAGAELGFMSWTTGQRELIPMLLGLYHLLPPARITKQKGIDWVILEEPELGLHPKATIAIMLMVLDLLQRGYKVIIATHAPIVLDVVFTIQRLKAHRADPRLLLKALGIDVTRTTQGLAEETLKKEVKVHAFDFEEDGLVTTTDISDLDPLADGNSESGWGGLTGLSGRMMEAVAEAANGDQDQ